MTRTNDDQTESPAEIEYSKLHLDTTHVRDILGEILDCDVSELEPLAEGQLSRVYGFRMNGKSYVAQFRIHDEAFAKAEALTSCWQGDLPLATVIARCKVVWQGRDIHCLITERLPGQAANQLSKEQQGTLAPALAEQLYRIVRCVLPDDQNWGPIERSGAAIHPTWRDALEAYFSTESAFYGNWKDLYHTRFLEKNVFERGYEAMLDLAALAPAKPQLVHGDFHLGNILTVQESAIHDKDTTTSRFQVTGIIDWEQAMAGDFVFDVATMDLWHPHLHFQAAVASYWQQRQDELPNFSERVRCYRLFKSLDGMRFFAKQNELESYRYVRRQVLELT